MKTSKKLLALVLSLGCIGALTACDMGVGSSNESVGGLSTESVESVESVETPETPDDGRLELPVVKGEEITKEQWDSAFDLLINPKNVTALVYGEQFRGGSPIIGNRDTWITRTTTLKYDNGRVLQVEESREEDTVDHREWYFEQIDDTGVLDDDYFGVKRYSADGEWVTTYPHKEMMTSPLDPRYKEVFDQLTFESETGSYVGTDVLVGSESRYFRGAVRMTFVDGKLYLLEWTKAEVDAGDLIWDGMKMIFSEYATTSVSRPEGVEVPVKPDDGGEVTPTVDWDGIFATMASYQNYTINMQNKRNYADGSVEVMDMVMESDVTASRDMSEVKGDWHFERYCSVEDGVAYGYYQTENGWVKEVYSDGEVPVGSAFMRDVISLIQGLTPYVAYDASEGMYIGRSFTMEAEDILFQVREARIQVENGSIVWFEFFCDIADEEVAGEMSYSGTIGNINTTVVELPEIEDEVTPTVDWESVLATMGGYQNYTIAINNLVTYADGSVEDMRIMMESDVASSRIMHEVNDVWCDETYYSVEDGVEYVYYQTESVWEKIVYPYEDEFPVGSALMGELMPMMQGLSAHVTYDAGEGLYIGGNFTIEFGGIEIKVREARMQVENGTVVWFEYISNITGEEAAAGNMRYSVTIGKINSTVVELPTVEEEPEKQGMTKEEWDAAFAKTANAENLTFEMGSDMILSGRKNELVQLKTNGATSITQTFTQNGSASSETRHFEYVDGVLYYYMMVEGEWTKYLGTEEVEAWLAKNDRRITLFAPVYDQLTYDAEKDLYYGENVVVDSVNGTSTVVSKVSVAFKDGMIFEIHYETAEESDGYLRFHSVGNTVVELPSEYVDTTKPEEEPSTEEAWQAIFDKMYTFDNLTLVIDNENVFFDKEGSQISTTTYKTTANALSLTVDSTNGTQRDYYERIDGVDYYYTQQDGKWVREAYTYGTLPIGTGLMQNLMISVVDACKQTTYNEAEEIYTAENIVVYRNDMAMTIYTIRVKVVDGALVWMESESDIVSSRDGVIGRSTSRMVWSDIGTTVVELPTIEEEPDGAQGMTQEEWDDAFAKTLAQTNYTMDMNLQQFYTDGRTESMTVCYNNMPTTVKYAVGDNVSYYDMEGDTIMIYQMADGQWTKKEYTSSSQPPFGSAVIQGVFSRYQAFYDAMVYDAENDCYVAKDVTFNEGIEVFVYELRMKFADGLLTELFLKSNMVNTSQGVYGVAETTYKVSDYGTTVVELPTIEEEPETDGNLTAEEWAEIIANTKANNRFTANIQKVFQYYNGTETQTQELEYQVAGDAMWIRQNVNGQESSNHYEKVGNLSYAYVNRGEYYTKQLYVFSTLYGAEMLQAIAGYEFELVCPQLTYNAEEDLYYGQNVATQSNGVELVRHEVRVKVVDGVIVFYQASADIVDENGEVIGISTATTTFGGFGTTVVVLPETVTMNTVDAVGWDHGLYGAMVMNNFTGSMIYTYEYSDGSPTKYYESYILMQENSTYQYGVQNGREYQQYYAKVDGVDYAYTIEDGVWTRKEVGLELNYNNTNMASVMNPLRSLYASFVFDEEKGAYTCGEITLDLGNGSYETIYNVELIFKDGVLTTLYYELALRNSDGVQNGVAKVTLSFWAMGETAFTLPEVNA